MEGLIFVRGQHLQVADGMFLPDADIPARIFSELQLSLSRRPNLRSYVPNFLEVDFILFREGKTGEKGEQFALFVSSERSAHLPTWGIDHAYLSGKQLIKEEDASKDISDTQLAVQVFKAYGFAPGCAVCGRYPRERNGNCDAQRERTTRECANLIIDCAGRRKAAVEDSKIFLSHRGARKPLIRIIDRGLRCLGLKTWLDEDDLAAGEPLVRGITAAFDTCAAGVFFISGDYDDVGVMRAEIEQAIHLRSTRPSGFTIIPLVLTDHGGTDDKVPNPLRTLKWRSVTDAEILPAIIMALPATLQKQIRFTPLK